MEVLVQGTISALGFLEDGVYNPEPDCYESIRDLIRFLRNDSRDLLARRICGERNIVENDLIPLLKLEDEKMFDIVLRLLANLMQPSIVSLMGKAPEDKEQWQLYWQLEENLRRSKLAFADSEVFKLFVKRLKCFIEKEWDDRDEDDRLVVERIFVLFRYVLCISASRGDDMRTSMENNSNDRVISAFLDSGIDQILVAFVSQSQERDFYLSILEIVACVFREHKAEDIASVNGRSEEEKRKAESELRQVFETELIRQNEAKRKMLSNRHSRFAGSYVCRGLSSVNTENDMIVHRPIKDASGLKYLDDRKKKRVVAKNRRPFEEASKTHFSSTEIREKLKFFAESVLESMFNRLMKNTKDQAFSNRLNVAQRGAGIHYFSVMKFFLAFARLSRCSSNVVSSCLGKEAFHHVQIQLDEYIEAAILQRKEGKFHGLRASYALSAYKELVLYHQYLLDKGNPEEQQFARSTCTHILTMEEYREMGCSIFKKFVPGSFSKNFLRELVLTVHHYVRLLERSYKKGELSMVQRKQKKRKERARQTSGRTTIKRSPCDDFEGKKLDEIWTTIAVLLSEIENGYEDPSTDQIPLRNTLNATDEEHQRFAMLYVQRALREKRVADAVGLYRAARDIWLTEGIFGNNETTEEEEFVELREIFFADLSEVSNQLLCAELEAESRFAGNDMVEGNEYDEDSENDEYETKEVNFDFNEYLGKFCRNEVLKWYIFLLRTFDTNSVELNRALVKMLHRIAFDLNMPSRLYQISLFHVFNLINLRISSLSSEERKKSPFYELYIFGYHLLKKCFKHYNEIGEKLAMEILFWKTPKTCYEIENGYGSYDVNRDDEKITWTEELEEEVRSLYNEYREMEDKPEGLDVLDFIEHNLSRPRTRRQIQKKLREFGLELLGAKAKKSSVIDRDFPLIELKALIERYDEMDEKPADMIDYLRENLEASGKGTFSRKMLIKKLTYLGIEYGPTKKPNKSRAKWNEGLITELTNLKIDYDEMDVEDKELVSITDYVIRRLSVKKPRRQIEEHLIELGVPIQITVQPRKSIKKKQKLADLSDNEEDEDPLSLASNLSDGEEGSSKFGSQRAEADTVSDQNEQNSSDPSSSKSSPSHSKASVNEEDIDISSSVPKTNKRNLIMFDDEDEDTDRLLVNQKESLLTIDDNSSSPDLKDQEEEFVLPVSKKRPRFMDSDDEDETENRPPTTPSVNQPAKRIRHIVMESDDEDAEA